ncbi:hypothetical protein DEO72_LG1g3156 [Vigna unguiculata]|uniref:Uncharacterized protein n=1 Tax=Vigna unguiculata TaxID=3917 RepID=A0A4D6KZF3_VIGUN|nr:hypothetical protein DEO72_LG1g3156 [Vigna unguiculata]
MINSIDSMEPDHLEKVDKFAEERAAWKKEKECWEEEKKRLGTWKVRCLDSDSKLNRRIADLKADYDELKEKYEGAEVELDDLKGFDTRFDVNKDVVDGQLVNEAKSSPKEEVEKEAAEGEKDAEAAVEDSEPSRFPTFSFLPPNIPSPSSMQPSPLQTCQPSPTTPPPFPDSPPLLPDLALIHI